MVDAHWFTLDAFSGCGCGEFIAEVQNNILGPGGVFGAIQWIFCHIDLLQLTDASREL
jgi:hypothetical protein